MSTTTSRRSILLTAVGILVAALALPARPA